MTRVEVLYVCIGNKNRREEEKDKHGKEIKLCHIAPDSNCCDAEFFVYHLKLEGNEVVAG